MTRTMTSTLGEQEQAAAGAALQATLVDLIDLSLVAKQAHWNLVGRSFRSVHLQLDEVVDTARIFSDTVAERAAAIGVSPDGRARTVSAGSVVPEPPAGWMADQDVVGWFVQALGAVIGGLRERIPAVEAADVVTQDLLISITAELEKHHWMFQAELA